MGWLSNASKTAKKGWETASPFLDPLDIYGTRDAKDRKAMRKEMGKDRDAFNSMMNQLPDYDGISKNGKLKPGYKLGWGNDISAPGSNIRGLESRMGRAQGLDIADVNAGTNFDQAQQNIDSLQARAFGTDTSPWEQKLYDQQSLDQSMMKDQLNRNIANQTQGSMNQMAATTGLDAASRERMMENANLNQMNQMQNLYSQGQRDRLGIGIQNEAQRMQLQQQLPGMNLQADQYATGIGFQNQAKDMNQGQFNNNLAMQKANMWGNMADTEAARSLDVNKFNKTGRLGVDQYNIGNKIADRNSSNAWDMTGWQQKMTGTGSNQTANAIAGSGSKGGFFQKLFGI